MGQLELNPRFQRRPVWTDKAKSFLMDTIIRGKPIPKIFIRQRINVTTKSSTRDVVDGQQRLRAILSFVKDGFVISKTQNAEYGGLQFSQLPEEVQSQILAYEISVDLLINLPDSEVLDIFSRLNSYAVLLNEQEKINANHFGPFKVLADRIGHKYNEYWTGQGILTSRSIVRMLDVNLVADLLIAMLEGIKSKKQIKRFYAKYEKSFDHDPIELEERFDNVVDSISSVFPDGLADTEFKRPHVYYSLFTTFAHCLYGLPQFDVSRKDISHGNKEQIRNSLERVEEIFETDDFANLTRLEQQFLQDCRRATTDEVVRQRRSSFLLSLLP